MTDHTNDKRVADQSFFLQHLSEAKTHFERTLESKHTEFDDLYPYMIEHPQFFWYKRYVAWAELLTIVKLCSALSLNWKNEFTATQVGFIENKVLSGAVLDGWFDTEMMMDKGNGQHESEDH